jgi:hypothetical protein
MSCAAASLASPAHAELEGTAPMTHIVLLGDSVFDNGPYVASGREVVELLRRRLPSGWRATLLARDGAVLAGVRDQVQRVPSEATHLFVSAGGNDGLGWTGIFGERAGTVAEALLRLAAVRRDFEGRYRGMLDDVLALGRPTAVCTIYDARFPDPAYREVAATALALLNDIITREAGRRGLPLLDLRTLLDDDADFANPIEPSVQGGETLARTILEVVDHHDFTTGRSAVFAGRS